MSKITTILAITAIIALLSSCTGRSDGKKLTNNDSINSAQQDNSYLESVYYRFPTPDEIFGFINNEKLKFDEGMMNPSSNADKYISSKTQTLNLGVYISDLAYITLFEAYSKSGEYYKNVHILSDKIRISSAYDLEVAQRIEKNLLNLDSLKTISVDSYSSMVEYLIVNNREKTLALLATGSYIECFNIAFNLAGKYSDSNPMIAKIIDLKYAFENLYSYLQIYSDDESVKEVTDDLKKLSELFSKLEKKNLGKTTVTQSADGNLVLGGGTKLAMDKKLFDDLRKEVTRLRENLVKTY